jgi:NAD(P)-dependent dehydrogenase (short-subunit alcohol dehydrogenase family)
VNGIGRATSHQFARNGAKAVFICDYKTDLLDIHAREIQSLYPGVEVHARKVDAAEEPDVENLVNEVLEKYGRLDIFFANAGITTGMERITEASADNFMKAMRTNALG